MSWDWWAVGRSHRPRDRVRVVGLFSRGRTTHAGRKRNQSPQQPLANWPGLGGRLTPPLSQDSWPKFLPLDVSSKVQVWWSPGLNLEPTHSSSPGAAGVPSLCPAVDG